MREEIEKQGLVLSETAMKERQAQYNQRLEAFKARFKESQQALQRKDQELTRKVLQGLQAVHPRHPQIHQDNIDWLLTHKFPGQFTVADFTNDLHVRHIFEPFYSKKVMGRSGTGLGLAVVWNTVLDHKGYIDVSSSRKATTFNLYFPITREETSGKVFNIPVEVYKGCGERVLIIDDVESQREISCRILEKLGYQTDSVGSGEEAVLISR